MDVSLAQNYLSDVITTFRAYKKLAEKALDQIRDEEYFIKLDEESNCIAVIIKHLAGNMLSRWTDFLTTDGEKPERNRDMEFVNAPNDYRSDVMTYWEKGWQRTFETLEALQPEDLLRTVVIRGERTPYSRLSIGSWLTIPATSARSFFLPSISDRLTGNP